LNFIFKIMAMTLSLIFFTTFISKVINWKDYKQTIASYKIIPPKGISISLLFFLINEAVIALSALLVGWRPFNAVMATILLLIYTIAISINLLRGRKDLACGCGGVLESERLHYGLVIRNLLFIIAVVLLSFTSKENDISDGWLTIGILLVSVALLLITAVISEFNQVRNQFRHLISEDRRIHDGIKL
jgi:Methylamine utilisation protein MauE